MGRARKGQDAQRRWRDEEASETRRPYAAAVPLDRESDQLLLRRARPHPHRKSANQQDNPLRSIPTSHPPSALLPPCSHPPPTLLSPSSHPPHALLTRSSRPRVVLTPSSPKREGEGPQEEGRGRESWAQPNGHERGRGGHSRRRRKESEEGTTEKGRGKGKAQEGCVTAEEGHGDGG